MSPRRLLGLATLAIVAGSAVDRWTRDTRATPEEKRQALAGDELVPDPIWQATRATTVKVAREDVWPWIVQMGFPTRRAGWYTPYWMDRVLFGIRVRSAERIVPELQHLAVGDVVPDSESGIAFFTVARIEAPRTLVLHSHTHPLPVYRDVNFAWTFVLEDVPEGTRLLVRARIRYRPVGPERLVRWGIAAAFGVGDLIQAVEMLKGIRERAEAPGRGGAPARDERMRS